ncbi:hydrolase [Paenibacillus baekrokdamisoli]|uniref:Hydrolase n=1 Tax=Paenibacillus baekrokdamisoli TaxID=1712516 RepID=A0A3G9IQ46_9BACL|nr:MBL fold metallo-hydrolase [Paenibacillus baekrokdamisoli]MBB3072090.1 glyoxylase-like metal-dependent hydrolase (beta-lactamase superfamily II) [Paenibacillus baekrokdamisoli]BBH20392.1 hydrolase [Paenibacillus baekrokdamisoli]
MRISGGIEMLELEAEAFGGRAQLNPTLIWDDTTALLIDTGMPGGWEQLREAMNEVGVPFAKLKAVILTHQDIDHIGNIPEILQESSGSIQVYAHELDKPYIEGILPLIKTSPTAMAQTIASLPEHMRPQAMALCENPPTARIDILLEDGDVLPYFGGIRVIFTPGHTPGHISLYHQESKTLVAADALINVAGKLRGPIAQTTLDMPAALRSLEKFLDFDIDSVICYHGGLSTDNVMEQLRSLVGNN